MELSEDPNRIIRILSYGYSRTKKAHMAKAVTPASQMALEGAQLKPGDLKVPNSNPEI